MKLLGYSERGILNALLYEIYYHAGGDDLLRELLAKAGLANITDCSILMEHSLSDFGDPDAVILGKSGAEECAIFVEAKVLAQTKDWSLDKEFNKFKKRLDENSLDIEKKVSSSNIFTQLYHKQKFMKHDILELETGIDFPKWSTNQNRKIGKNCVVRKITTAIKKHKKAFYLMLLPDNDARLNEFFKGNLTLPAIHGWDISDFHYLTWQKVENFCKTNKLTNTLAVFEHNGAQIYRKQKG